MNYILWPYETWNVLNIYSILFNIFFVANIYSIFIELYCELNVLVLPTRLIFIQLSETIVNVQFKLKHAELSMCSMFQIAHQIRLLAIIMFILFSIGFKIFLNWKLIQILFYICNLKHN